MELVFYRVGMVLLDRCITGFARISDTQSFLFNVFSFRYIGMTSGIDQ